MSSMRFEPPLVIEPVPSRQLRNLVIALHASALLPLGCLAVIRPFLTLPVLCFIAGSAWLQWQKHIRGSAEDTVMRAVWHRSGMWELTTAGGSAIRVFGNPIYFISLRIILLSWPMTGRRTRRLILFPDSAAPDVIRRLRTRLRSELPNS